MAMDEGRIDAVQQRRIAIYCFLGIQAFKIAQTISFLQLIPSTFSTGYRSDGTSTTASYESQLSASYESQLSASTILIWCLADFCYFVGLRRYTRPRLNLLGVSLLTLAMFGLNAGFIAALSSRFNNQVTSSNYYAEQTLADGPAGKPLVVQEIDSILNDSFILGSHTVKVRPPTKVKLNPNSTLFCVINGQSEDLEFPIMIKGVAPFYVDYQVSHSGKVEKVLNHTITLQDAIKSVANPMQGQRHYYSDPIIVNPSQRRVALYALKSTLSIFAKSSITINTIRDSTGDEAAITGSKSITVHSCPSMEWKDVPSVTEKCLDQEFQAELEVQGVLPLNVLFVIQSGNNERVESVEVEREIENMEIEYGKKTVSIKGKVDVSDAIVYKLLRVTDGLNNSIQYSTILANSNLPPILPKSTNKILEEKPQDVFVVNGHSYPTAAFGSCQGAKIRTVYDAQYQKAPSASVSAVFEGVAPFSLAYDFVPASGSPSQPHVLDNIEGKSMELIAYEPGYFVLKEIHDKFCGSKLPDSLKKCIIQPVVPPTFAFTASPIEESCFGAVGTNVDLSFTGEAPYWVEYVLEKTEFGKDTPIRVAKERELFQKHRSLLVLKPKEPGMYRYLFERVGDRNYNEGIAIDGASNSLTQIIHPHSSASFFLPNMRPPYRFLKCKGDSVNAEVRVQGSGPWVVTYEVTHAKTKRYTVNVTEKAAGFQILVDDLTDAGIYNVDLVEIKDGNGCNVKLSAEPIVIEVMQSRPTASFSSSKSLHILEGGASRVPLSLSGRSPFQIGIKNPDGSSRIVHVSGASSQSIELYGAGTHELLSVSDSICTGSVQGLTKLQVLTLDKPFMKLVTDQGLQKSFNKPDVCAGESGNFQIDLNGKAPFKVKYTLNFRPLSITGHEMKRETKELVEVVDTSFLRISFDSQKPGIYTYKFTGISDDNYKSFVAAEPITVTQRINNIPKALFGEADQKVFYCMSSSVAPYKLNVLLYGKAPFNVKIEQKRDSQHVGYIIKNNIGLDSLKSRKDGGFEWVPTPETIDGMGKHEFLLHSVSDGNGCTFNFDSSDPVSTFFEIADQARITSFNPSDVCIGDLLSYTLQGTPPFTIGYAWKGEPQPELIVADPMLSFWMGGAGDLVITKICNSAECCDENVATDTKLTTHVHALPRAIVGSGDDSFDDIKEGDESSFSVDFEGQPPFSFTYARSRSLGSESAVKEELFTVKDIKTKHWSIQTSQEGTFRVKSIQDLYCAYPRRLASTSGANKILH